VGLLSANALLTASHILGSPLPTTPHRDCEAPLHVAFPSAVFPLAGPESLDFRALLEAAFISASEDMSGDQEEQGGSPGESEGGQNAPKRSNPVDDGPFAKRTCSGHPDVSVKPVSRQHAKRRRSRKAALLLQGQFAQARTIQTYVQPTVPLVTPLITDNLPATSCGYHATPRRLSDAQKRYTLSDLQRLGFKLVAWDG
jgi:hypothetical protein